MPTNHIYCVITTNNDESNGLVGFTIFFSILPFPSLWHHVRPISRYTYTYHFIVRSPLCCSQCLFICWHLSLLYNIVRAHGLYVELHPHDPRNVACHSDCRTSCWISTSENISIKFSSNDHSFSIVYGLINGDKNRRDIHLCLSPR